MNRDVLNRFGSLMVILTSHWNSVYLRYKQFFLMRNPEMTKMRDRKLVEKFYQLYDVKRIRLEDVLFRMSQEIFFLDTNYIYKRIFYIPGNLSYYERLKEGKKPEPDTGTQMRLDF